MHSKTKRKITGVLSTNIILLLTIILTTAGISFGNYTEELCSAPGCYYLGDFYLKTIDEFIDPCDDFYGHVCTRWNSLYGINLNFFEWNARSYLTYILDAFFQRTVLKPSFAINSTSPKVASLLYEFYDTCLNYKLRVNHTAQHLLSLYSRIGFPQIGFPIAEGYDWREAFHIAVTEMRGISNMTLWEDKNDILEKKTFEKIAAEKNVHIEELFKFVNVLNSSCNISLMQETIEKVVDIDTNVTAEIFSGLPLFGRDIIDNIGKLLDKEDLETVANYIGFKVMIKATHIAGVLFGECGLDESRKFCFQSLFNYFPFAIAHIYLSTFNLGNNELNKLKEMSSVIKTIYEEGVRNSEWMDNFTKSTAVKKIEKMSMNFLGPEFILDEDVVFQTYEKVDTYTSFFDKLLFVQNKRDHDQYTLHSDPTVASNSWPHRVTSTFARYSVISNAVFVPAGMIFFPLYAIVLPPSVNFGTIGSIIASMMTYAFTNPGRFFDENKTYRLWWSNHSLEKTKDIYKCFTDHYDEYISPNTRGQLFINLEKPVYDHVADSVGLKTAFLAYTRFMENCQENCTGRLPKMNYTANQQYFVSYAFSKCGLYKTTDSLYGFRQGIGTPAWISVTGTLRNSKEFSEAFNCPLNSFMNPENKCSFW